MPKKFSFQRNFILLSILGLALATTGCSNSSTQQLQTPQMNSTSSSDTLNSGISMPFTNQTSVPMKVVRNGNDVTIDMTTEETTVQLGNGKKFNAWTFDGTVPGPVLYFQQGDNVTLNLHNIDPHMFHSIDLHAALVAPNKTFVEVPPSHTTTLHFQAKLPGVYMYHCGTPPMDLHIAQGMYGAVVVTPKGQNPPDYTIVQSEFYKDEQGILNNQPEYVVFNGKVNQYVDHPLKASVNHPLTMAFVNAGPNEFSAFHIVGTVLHDVEASGNPNNHLYDIQTYTVAPGDGALIKVTFYQPGVYTFVSHSMQSFAKGAIGKIDVSP